MRHLARAVSVALFVSTGLGCGAAGGGGGGGGGAGAGSGPRSAAGGGFVPNGPNVVVSDGTGASPLLSPYPDDRLTRPDPSAVTGRRLDMPLPDRTDLERRLRDEFERLDGFGVYAPISVTLDGPIDLAAVRDDTVFVVNVEPGSARRGERAALDLGRGSFLTDISGPRSFYPRDPLAALSGDLVFEPGNPGAHFEAASNTLILRPLRPLEEGARHAVVLTDRLRDAAGGAVTAPAGFSRPTGDDATLGPALAAAGVTLGEVRYQWAFTTGTPTRELRAIADGHDGFGPLAAAMAAAQRPAIERIDDLRTTLGDGSPYTLDAGFAADALGCLADLARLAAPLDSRVADAAALLDLVDLSSVDYVAFGSAFGPDFRSSARGTFDVSLANGTAAIGRSRVTFLMIVPRATSDNGWARQPYPVLLTGHGNQRSRLDGLGVARSGTQAGFAVVAFDAVGHGPEDAFALLPNLVADIADQNLGTEAAARAAILALALAVGAPVDIFASVRTQMRQLAQAPPLRPLLADGRATDVDGDGATDSGATFFSADVFRTRDIVRQTAVDAMTLMRAFGGLGQDRNGNGWLDAAEGDLDQDGMLDFGGPGATFAYTGISLGGINGAVIMGADPVPSRAALMVPGGGLTDIVLTSSLGSVTNRVFREVFGVCLVGQPGGGGAPVNVSAAGAGAVGPLTTVPGGAVLLANHRSGDNAAGPVLQDGGFRVHLAADAGDAIEVRSLDGQGALVDSLAFASPGSGLGLERSTPRTRQWVALAAIGLEGADPACYAPHWLTPPPGRPPKNMLIQVSLGDTTVPVFTGAALGRAAGLVSGPRNDLLIQAGVISGAAIPSSNVDRLYGVESTWGAGIRFHGVNSHVGMLVPDPSNLWDGARYAAAAQAQAFGFLETGAIDDSDPIFDRVLP